MGMPLIGKIMVAGIKHDSPEIKCFDNLIQCGDEMDYCAVVMFGDERIFIPANSEEGIRVLATLDPQIANQIRASEARFATTRNTEPVTQPDLPGGPQRGRAAGAPIAGSDR